MKNRLVEGEDYYIQPDGLLVFTASYLLERGYCCGNGCRNCPYEYKEVGEPRRTKLLAERKKRNEEGNKQ
ncbi:MAG TPA: DUF5522 domain-containing protein [Flavipsychrobacter sp.]|nr:DUF5522 domain-containing protein [Flavipsychrobacter sp.]